jgi:hypothetical protein
VSERGDVQVCGCDTRDGHAEPHVDPLFGIAHHGKRDPREDPPPHEVPGSGGWNGLYTESPDAYCLCGHPNYLSCYAWATGDNLSAVTIERRP